MMYLCSVWYSFADMVYRSAFLRIGSAVDFAEILSRGGLGPSLEEDAILAELGSLIALVVLSVGSTL